jgi:outer membrane protein
MKKLFFSLLIGLTSLISEAQDTLKLIDALNMGLKNNLDIQIAQNNVSVATINNYIGVAGGLPSVIGNASENLAFNNINQKLSSGIETNKSGVKVTNLNAGLAATYTLFNGFKIVTTQKRLKELQAQNQNLLLNQIQNTMALIYNQYFNVVTQQLYIKTLVKSIELAKTKLDLINNKRSIGVASDLDVFQAEIDLQTATQNYANQELQLTQAKSDVITTLNLENRTLSYLYPDTLVIDSTLDKMALKENIKKNTQLVALEQQTQINQYLVKELQSQRLPLIRLNAGYTYASTQSDAGLIQVNNSYGPSVGATLQIPIFNGQIYSRQKKVGIINVKTSEFQQKSLKNTLENGIDKTYEAYQNSQSQIKQQLKSVKLSVKLLNLTVERYKLNQATVIDLKTAQNNYETSLFRLYSLRYQAKLAEVELKRLGGLL